MSSPAAINDAQTLFRQEISKVQRMTHSVFRFLLPAQWLAAVFCAVWVSPLTWSGSTASLHNHVIAATAIGGLLTVFPLWLMRYAPERAVTRHVACSAQLLFSALFIHLLGGRIEAHFHVFGSLALVAFYRDYWVFLPAVAVTLVDHLLRGLFWPESVFGVITPSALRAIEHAAWVAFESGFLLWGIRQSRGHLHSVAEMQFAIQSERDNLEKRVAERTLELAETRDFFANVINSLDAQICILDSDGYIITTNSSWRTYGEERGADPARTDRGANYLQICRSAGGECGESAHRLADSIEQIIRGDSDGTVLEYDCHEPNRKRWFQARVSPFLGDKSKAAVAVAHVEITDRVKANQETQEATSKAESLASLITESPNELYIFNQVNLRFEVVNDGAVAASGYSRDELLGMTPVDIKPEFDEAHFRQKLGPLAGGAVDTLEFQTTHQRKDETNYPVQVSLHAAVYNSTPVYVAFVTDLSETQRLERRLSQAQKLESIGQLAAGIAHEINTPMQCVSNNVEFLTDCQARLLGVIDKLLDTINPPAGTWEERRETMQRLIEEARYEHISSQAPEALADAAEASKRVIEIVRAMKAMSHPGTQDKASTDVNEVIRNAATISRNRWKYAAELEEDLDLNAPAIPALGAELNQVILNLLVNAADAIVEKNGENGPLGKITVRTQTEENTLRIEVEDSGCGAPPEVRDKVFDPFFTTKQVGKGTGQGLSISYDVVVNKHGGTIDMLSTEGEGSTFVIHLPLDEPTAESPIADEALASSNR